MTDTISPDTGIKVGAWLQLAANLPRDIVGRWIAEHTDPGTPRDASAALVLHTALHIPVTVDEDTGKDVAAWIEENADQADPMEMLIALRLYSILVYE